MIRHPKILPACFRNAGDQTLRSHLAELDTADAEQADIALGTARDLAAVVLADRIRVAGQLRKRNPSLLVVDLTALQLGSNLLALVCIAVCEFHAFYLACLH